MINNEFQIADSHSIQQSLAELQATQLGILAIVDELRDPWLLRVCKRIFSRKEQQKCRI